MRKILLTGAAFGALAVYSVPPARAQLAQAQMDNANVVLQTSGDLTDNGGPTSDSDGQSLGSPSPGQVIVRLNGRFRAYAGLFDDSSLNRTYSSTVYSLSVCPAGSTKCIPGAVSATAGTTTQSNKQAGDGITEYTRLYPGFDGMTEGGLKYGASIEIRQDSTAPPGGGANGSVSGAEVGEGSLYIRREWGYIGTADLGTLRFGTTDGPSSLFLTGVLENFNDGGWNGDVRYGLASNAQLRWPFADDSSAVMTNKLVYLSPQYQGFDFGVSFEPSTAASNIDDGNCASANSSSNINVTNGSNTIGTISGSGGLFFAGTGCNRLDSTTLATEAARRRNTVDALLRYRGTFGDLGVIATGSYVGGGHVAYTGPLDSTSGSGSSETYTKVVTYQGLSIADFGLAATYGGLLVGANYQFGTFSNAFASGASQTFTPAPTGAPKANAWSAGASYAFGPAILGAAWVETTSPGAYAYTPVGHPAELASSTPLDTLGQRKEEGLNAGGTLKLAPGLGLILTYLWDQRSQPGYNFLSSTINPTTTPDSSDKIHAQAVTLGTSLTW